MIFTTEDILLIRARRKTQTIQPVRLLKPPRPPILEKTCPYTIGHLYHARRDTPITITNTRRAQLKDIGQQDARREGYRFTTQFLNHWAQQHDTADPNQPIWIITFTAGDIRDHFDQPRLLAARPGHVRYEQTPGSKRWQIATDTEEHQDYTNRPNLAMPGTGEELSPAEAARYAAAAHSRDAQRRKDPDTEFRDDLLRDLEKRLRRAEKSSTREISRTIRAIEHQIRSLDRKLKAS